MLAITRVPRVHRGLFLTEVVFQSPARLSFCDLLPRRKLNVTNHAGVVHFALASALCDFLAQIRQPNVGPVFLNQFLLSILAQASAFLSQDSRAMSPGYSNSCEPFMDLRRGYLEGTDIPGLTNLRPGAPKSAG